MSSDSYQIAYLPHHRIDKSKWDGCIDDAHNGLIYGYSFYLDQTAGDWDALVLNDYEAVMPLPWKKKAGVHYIYQPFFTAQLGLFGNALSDTLLNRFLHAVPKKFLYWDYALNEQNIYRTDYPLYERTNCVLDLNRPYAELHRGFRPNTRRMAQKAAGVLQFKEAVDVRDIVALAAAQVKDIAAADWQRFEKLYHQLHQRGMATSCGMLSANGTLLASGVFFFSHKRAYYVLAGNHPGSRNAGASHALIDHFIRMHAQQPLVLDFEGSDIPGIRFFFRSFGAAEKKYAAIKLNRLPWWLRWLKK